MLVKVEIDSFMVGVGGAAFDFDVARGDFAGVEFPNVTFDSADHFVSTKCEARVEPKYAEYTSKVYITKQILEVKN